jgi:hypothetical protein
LRARAHLGVYALFVALVLVYTWPLVSDPARLLPDNADPRLFSWVMLTAFGNLVSRPALLFHGNAFYPTGNTLSLAEPLLVPSLLAGPLHVLTGNPVLAYNVTLVLFWALSGWAMYAVAWAVTRHHGAAFVAALVFTFAPYRIDHYKEFQMEMAFGIPLALYALVRFLETQRARHLALLLAAFWIQAASVWYYAIILGLGLTAVALQVLALRWTGWRVRSLVAGAAGVAVLGLCLWPVARPYFQTRRELGYQRGLGEAVRRSADVLSYLEARPNWLYERFTEAREWEASLFLGIAGLVLAAAGVLWVRAGREDPRGRLERWLARAVWVTLALALVVLGARGRVDLGVASVALSFTGVGVALLVVVLARHAAEGGRRWRTGLRERRLSERDWAGVLLGLAAVAFLMSLGPIVELDDEPIGPGLYAWLWPYLLPLHAIRGPTRIGILYLFAGALLAALGVRWLHVHAPVLLRRPALAALMGVLLCESAWMPLPYETVPSVRRPVDEVLRGEAPGGVVLEWPTNIERTDADAMLRSLAHGRRVVNGLSGFVPDQVRKISMLLTTPGSPFPVPEAQAALRRIYPLRYLVVRLNDPAVTEEWRPVWRALRHGAPPLLRYRGSFGDEDLYELEPLPERGVRLERWVSHDFLRTHPVLALTARALDERAGLSQWVEVRLNERPIERVRLGGDGRGTLVLDAPYRVAAPNVIELVHGYSRPPEARDGRYRIGATGVLSPGDLQVESRGDVERGRASVWLDGVELARNERGYNLVALAPDGRVVASVVFDTFLDARESRRLASWVARLPAGTIVAGAVRDEASAWLLPRAVEALRSLGVAHDLSGRYREAHAFVGVKGAPAGSALERGGPHAAEVTVGWPEAGLEFELTGFALEALRAR